MRPRRDAAARQHPRAHSARATRRSTCRRASADGSAIWSATASRCASCSRSSSARPTARSPCCSRARPAPARSCAPSAIHEPAPRRRRAAGRARLRRAARGAGRERAVRPRPRRVHGRDPGPPRRLRSCGPAAAPCSSTRSTRCRRPPAAAAARARVRAWCARSAATRSRDVDVRVIAACPADLDRRGRARASFGRTSTIDLSVLRVVLPPLRARREDLVAEIRELLTRRGFFERPASGQPGQRPAGQARAADGVPVAGQRPRAAQRARSRARAVAQRPQLRPAAHRHARATRPAIATSLAVRTELPYAEAKLLLLDGFEARYLRRAAGPQRRQHLGRRPARPAIDRKHLRTLLRKHELIG